MKQSIIYIFTFVTIAFISPHILSQNGSNEYQQAFSNIESMLLANDTLDFKRAVFLTENSYLNTKLDENAYDGVVHFYASISEKTANVSAIIYNESDKNVAMAQCGTFIFFTDTIPVLVKNEVAIHPPFTYNHDDFAGQKDWANMFVTSLIKTYRGNCHSLPYLYKMIMDELGYECHLALAPNHIYIKVYNKKVGWYNIELTCAAFPTDAWYAASGYIHTDAIRNGIYMRALSDKEAVAMTLVDLAQGYQAKFGMDDGSFMLQCCNTALEHFPDYINAMLLKSEILTTLHAQAEMEQKEELLVQMNDLFADIHKLGYRKMPSKMYAKWINSLDSEESNQSMKAILNPRTK